MLPDILTLMRSMATATGQSPGYVGKLASGSGDFYGRLQRGHDITSRRAARVIQYCSDHWPADLPWPSDIPRPSPSADSPAAARAAADTPMTPAPDSPEEVPWYRRPRPPGGMTRRGRIRDVQAFLDSLAPNGIAPVLRSTYDAVIRHYADGRARGELDPRPGTEQARVLEALVACGDTRFTRRMARRAQHRKLAERFGLTSGAA